jgi:hypothetical protein
MKVNPLCWVNTTATFLLAVALAVPRDGDPVPAAVTGGGPGGRALLLMGPDLSCDRADGDLVKLLVLVAGRHAGLYFRAIPKVCSGPGSILRAHALAAAS